jgi:DNA-binding response OmpR family regulator
MASILLVEDRDDVRELLKETILLVGHDLKCARTWVDGLRALAAGTHDVLVADVRLPDGSGHDLARRALARGQKAVLITGHPDEMRKAPPEIIYLHKPFLMRALLDALEQHVGASPLPPPPSLVGTPRPDRPLQNPFAQPAAQPAPATPIVSIAPLAAAQSATVDAPIALAAADAPQQLQ